MLYKNTHRDIKPLFNAVGCICINKDKILLLKRVAGKSYPGYWGVPSGKIKDKESSIQAMVRELFEETGILLSKDNLEKINTYHVVNNDMNFLYTLFITKMPLLPTVKINNNEHIGYDWFRPDDALRLELVPDVDECIFEVFPLLRDSEKQLELFTGYTSFITKPTNNLETLLKEIVSLDNLSRTLGNKQNISISFGPPGAGKSDFFKELSSKDTNRHLVSDNSWSKRSSNLNLYLRKAFNEDQKAFFFHFQMESLITRFIYTVQAPNNSLVDESIFTTLAYSRALYRLKWIKKFEYEVFYKYYILLFNLLSKSIELIYLNCDIDILKQRLKGRKRQHERFYSDEYILALHYAFNEVAIELEESKIRIIKLDSSNIKTAGLVEKYVSLKTS